MVDSVSAEKVAPRWDFTEEDEETGAAGRFPPPDVKLRPPPRARELRGVPAAPGSRPPPRLRAPSGPRLRGSAAAREHQTRAALPGGCPQVG